MKISVCMATYNGEKYIEEQLASILLQTKRPDEVILCDDGSTDRTVEKIQRFIEKNGLQDSWILYQNAENKGYPGNFYYAMSLCTGDTVFLADQDDIWHQTKIEKMVKVLEEHSEAKCVCCKFGLIDGDGQDIHSIMAPTQTKGTSELRKVTISDVFYKCEWPGMVMAYRNDWYHSWNTESLIQAEQNQTESIQVRRVCVQLTIPHDFLVCARAAEENGFFQMDEELAYHRRHDNNTGGEEHRLKKLLNKQRKLREIEDYLRIMDAFAEEKVLKTQDGQAALQRKLRSMHGRYDALKSGKISEVIKNAWKQKKEVRLVTVLCDMTIVKQVVK